MKKLLFVILFIIPFNVMAISASSAIAMDLDNDIIYYEKNINNERLIASITKIMTAIVTIECTDLDKEVTVDDDVLKAYGSAIYLEVGEKIKIRDLLYGLMLRSGNDAAIVLAKNVAGSMDKFSLLMNELAQKIGMKNSYFYNAHGLEEKSGEGNLSTAKDMALLTRYAMKNEEFKKIFGTKKYKVTTNKKTYSWINKNKLLHSEDYITGGKTGFTEKARRTLVTTASRNNINVVIVTLNDGNDFLDHKNLYKEIFKDYEAIKVIDKKKIKIKNEKRFKKDNLYLKEDIYLPVKNKQKDNIKIEYELYNDVKYKNGDIVGKVLIRYNNKIVRKENIYVEVENVKKKKESFFHKIIRWFSW